MTRMWWVARGNNGAYFFCPYRRGVRIVDVDALTADDDASALTPNLWHRAGGLRLKPGDGPIQVTLELTVRRVR